MSQSTRTERVSSVLHAAKGTSLKSRTLFYLLFTLLGLRSKEDTFYDAHVYTKIIMHYNLLIALYNNSYKHS